MNWKSLRLKAMGIGVLDGGLITGQFESSPSLCPRHHAASTLRAAAW